MKTAWLAIFGLFFLCSALNGAAWTGYPFLVQTPYLGGGAPQGPRSSSFLMILVDSENPGIRPNATFRQMLSEITGVCSDKDTFNVSCEEWVNGESYLILRKLDLTTFPERAEFMLVTIPPQSLLDYCQNIPEDEAPCIPGNYRNVPRGRNRRMITSQIFAVYPNHGPRNPISFWLSVNLANQNNSVVFEGMPFTSEPLAKTAEIKIGFQPVRNNPPIITGENVGPFLKFGQEVEEIELTLDYRGKPLVAGTAVRCDLPDCGLSLSTVKPPVPTRDTNM